jgi:CO/xanthine dehydrogenase Mo-binding subunit
MAWPTSSRPSRRWPATESITTARSSQSSSPTPLEIADEAAGRLHITYTEEKPSATFGSPGLTHGRVEPGPGAAMPAVGDPITAFDAAPVTVDAHYATPPQHHNPMELMTTACSWEGGYCVNNCCLLIKVVPVLRSSARGLAPPRPAR